MNYKDLWPAIQADLFGAISADPFLGNRAGVLVEPGDVPSVIEMKLARAVGAGLDGKNGVGFLVLPIEKAHDENPALPFGPLKLTISVQWCENVILNHGPQGTGLPIRVYAALTQKILKLYTPVSLCSSLTAATPAIHEFTDDKNKGLRIGMVEFHTFEADDQPMNRLARPQISVAGSAYPHTVTVTAPANTQTVYYTTDGSHPYANNPQAQIYCGPVIITQPGLFRARAFADGWVASDTAAVNFS